MSSMRDQLWPVFVAEVAEQLDGLESTLEPGASSPAAVDVNALFRFFHTIKSNGSMMDFRSMEQLAHASEDLLFVLRKNELPVDAASYQLVARAVDALKRQLAHITASKSNPPADEALVAELAAHAMQIEPGSAGKGNVAGTDPVASTGNIAGAEDAGRAVPVAPVAAAAADTVASETMRVSGQTLDALVANVGNMAMRENRFSHVVNAETVEQAMARSRELLERMQPGQLTEQDLLAIEQLLHAFSDYHDRVVESDYDVRGALRQIEQDVLDLRVVSISAVFNRLPVLVKKTSESSRKQVDLVTEGSEVKVDKRMVDTLMEPLVHIIRNAIDHGIEDPAERRAAGKPETGLVTIRASQDSGMLKLEISDDGKGLDHQRIEAKARRLGLIGPHDKELAPARIHDMIFMPGFSTSDTITETSGRGVGMDVVKTRISSLGGTVEVDSVPGKYTRFLLSLPLSVAIQGVLLVQETDSVFALPLHAVSEIIAVDPASLQLVNGQSTLYFRGGVLPVTTLSHLLGRSRAAAARATYEVVVITLGDYWLGLMIDGVIGRQELIVREVHADLAALPGLGGVSMLGDGRVVIILDLRHLFDMAASHRQDVLAGESD